MFDLVMMTSYGVVSRVRSNLTWEAGRIARMNSNEIQTKLESQNCQTNLAFFSLKR